MRLLFVADLHYSLKQFDWLLAHASEYDAAVIGGDLLDLSSALDMDVQIAIVEKYLGLLRRKARLVVCSGNHDGDSRNSADESVAAWLCSARAEGLHVDGDSFGLGKRGSGCARGGMGISRAGNWRRCWNVRPPRPTEVGSGSITRRRRVRARVGQDASLSATSFSADGSIVFSQTWS